MDPQQIDHFFKVLDDAFNKEAEIILAGAAAACIMGSKRPSMDIDFAIKLKNSGEQEWDRFESAIKKAKAVTGIQVDYIEDIDRWGMITLLDYENHKNFYKQEGNLTLWVLDPAFWSIGKMTRFLDPDIQDMIQVFKKTKISPIELAKVWGRALRESPRSPDLISFRRHVEHFFASYGRKIWGHTFSSTNAVRQFHKSAGLEK